MQYAADTLKADKDIVLAAVASNGEAIDYVDKNAQMWSDKDFVLAMVKILGRSAIQ